MGIHTTGRIRRDMTVLTYAHKVFEALDTPMSLSCSMLLRYGEHEQLARKNVDPLAYLDPLMFALDIQATKLLSKYPYLDSGIDTRLAAKKEFIRAETICRSTNTRFRNRSDGEIFSPSLERILSDAQGIIATILGPVPSFEQMDFGFGPGAAFGVRGDTSAYKKIISDLECTYTLVHKLPEFLGTFPGWFPMGPPPVNPVAGSELSFVPKNARTDRPICIEPLLNGLMQKGFGDYMRKRLRRFGVDLSDQGINQKLASRALQDGLATVDFTSASDLISHGLVLNLLPIDWFEALDVSRSPRYFYEGAWYNFHKFSSMGNAYTFELETLIFYALACAVCKESGIEFRTGENLSVYGDDVIIPQAAFHLFQQVTEVCGFEFSQGKSFSSGLFYESCGHDYFGGYFVRPFYVKKRMDTFSDIFLAANNCRRMAKRFLGIPSLSFGKHQALTRNLLRVRAWCAGYVPKRLQAYGPEGCGDGHLCMEFDEAQPSRSRQNPTWECWEYRSHVETAIEQSPPGDLWPMAYALYLNRVRTADDLVLVDPHRNLLSQIAREGDKWWKFSSSSSSIDRGAGYSVRGKTRTQMKTLLTHHWESGVNWNPETAVSVLGLKPRLN